MQLVGYDCCWTWRRLGGDAVVLHAKFSCCPVRDVTIYLTPFAAFECT